jgi:hypothetical protein
MVVIREAVGDRFERVGLAIINLKRNEEEEKK